MIDVITLTVDLGAGPEIEGVAEKAKKAGAIDSVILDVKEFNLILWKFLSI